MNPSIEAKDLVFSYDREDGDVLKGLSFRAEGEGAIGIIGANGAGKSTLLRLLVGLLAPTSGSLSVCGLPLEKKNYAKIRALTGYVFQESDDQLFSRNIYEDVAFGPANYGYPPEEVKRRAEAALARVGMLEYAERPAYRLSGGQKKMASLATILSLSPEIILLDEPSVALDPRNRRRLIDMINSLEGLKLIAAHDLDMILDTCDRTILLSDGKIAADGPTREILSDEKLLVENGLELPLSMV